MNQEPIAQVKVSCGRTVLFVKGLALIMEGDPCRTSGIPEEFHDPIPPHVYEGTIGGKPISRDDDPELIRFFVGERWNPAMLEYVAKKINEP